MRRTGFVDAVTDCNLHDHLCWAFDSPGEYRTQVGDFLSDGLAVGQRVLFIAEGAREDDLDGVDGFAAARGKGAAQVQDLRFYGLGGPVDPAAQIRMYAQATDRALADGHTGLRVAADVTALVGTAEARAAFARYEHLIDAYMARHPMSAMCGYDRGELDEAAVAELAAAHPLARRFSTPLRLFAADRPGVAAVLAGEIDMAGHARLRAALDRADLPAVDGVVTIDAREVTFMDHRALIQLVEHVRGRGAATVLLVGPDSVVAVLASLLPLRDLRVVVS